MPLILKDKREPALRCDALSRLPDQGHQSVDSPLARIPASGLPRLATVRSVSSRISFKPLRTAGGLACSLATGPELQGNGGDVLEESVVHVAGAMRARSFSTAS